MLFDNWRRWLNEILGASKNTPRRQGRGNRFKPECLLLEERLTPANFTPTTFSDLAISSLAQVDSAGHILNQGNAITLRSAIIAANANGNATNTINLNNGIYSLSIVGNVSAGAAANDSNPMIGDLNVDSTALTISGAGRGTTFIQQTTLHDRVFDVNENFAGTFNFTIENLTVEGGRDDTTGGGGGAIYSGAQTSGLTDIENVQFLANQTTGSGSSGGGAVLNQGGGLTVNNCLFGDGTTGNANSTPSIGGAIAYDSFGTTGAFSLTNSTFNDNSVSGFDGGAVSITQSDFGPNFGVATANISACNFRNNSSITGDGGAIYLESGTLTVTTSNFQSNSAGAYGGAIAVNGGGNFTATVSFSRFVGNTATATNGGNSIAFGTGNTSFTANDDWWGANSGPAFSDFASVGGFASITDANWLQLEISASPSTIATSGTSTLSADILAVNTGGTTAASNLNGLPAFPNTATTIFSGAVLGTLTTNPTTQFVNGVAAVNAVFTAGGISGAGHVSGTADSQTVTANITITGTTWIVTDPNGNAGSGSPVDVTLPYAVAHAQDGDAITFANALSGDTITLNSTLTINHNYSITGLGAANLFVSGNSAVQDFLVSSGVTAAISNLTIENGTENDGGGGGVLNLGTLALSGCMIAGNNGSTGGSYDQYGSGGGILNLGTLSLTNSTLANNTAAYGGGLANFTGGNATINDCTFFANTGGSGAGICDYGGTSISLSNSTVAFNNGYGTWVTSMDNTIVAGNTGGVTYAGTAGTFVSTSTTGLATALAYNGGQTETLALSSSSPALFAGDPAQVNTISQNNVTRPNLPDIGAFQSKPTVATSAANLPDTAASLTINGNFFDPTVAHDSVVFNNGIVGTVTAATSTQLTVTISAPPTALGALTAVVTCDGNTSGTAVPVATVVNSTWVVTDANGSAGSGSLIDVTLPYAVAHALSADSITFANTLSGDTVTLNGTLTISQNIAITGLGAANLAVSGNNSVQVFLVNAAVTASIAGLTIENGLASDGAGISNNGTLTLTNDAVSNNGAISNTQIVDGAGIFNSGNLNISGSTINGNTAYFNGGGIYNTGTLTMSNSTVFANAAYTTGGGIDNVGGTLNLTDDTITGNYGWNNTSDYPVYGGGIYTSGGTAILNNTIVAGNITTGAGQDVYGTLATANYDLIGVNSGFTITNGSHNDLGVSAGLASGLANHGGPTLTVALLPGSAAIGAGDPAQSGTTSQNGVVRGATLDIGAFQAPLWIVTDSNGAAGSGSPADITLPYAVAHAQDGDAITFANALSGDTITLNSTLTINHNYSITGLGAANLFVSGNSAVQDFLASSGVTAAISNLTIENGIENDGGGGGVLNLGTLALSGCMIAGNNGSTGGSYDQYGSGGGILNLGTLSLTNSTLANNTATYGGGLANFTGGNATINDCTFFANTGGSGAGICDYGGTSISLSNSTVAFNNGYGTWVTSMDNTIVAGNTGGVTYAGTAGTFVSTSTTGLATTLAYNGGQTETLALSSSSPALRTGDPGQVGTISQNGVTRPADPDIGAFQSPLSITNVVINQNISSLYNAAGQPFAGAQRSMVDDIVYTFSQPVNILSPSVDPNVFTIAVSSGWTGTPPTPNWAAVAGSGNTQWAVTFSGNGVTGNSIANGAYTIAVTDPHSITDAGTGTQQLSLAPIGIGRASQNFYRLYGDINGDEVVNNADNIRFKQALTTYNAALDWNADSAVNNADNVRFKQSLSIAFTGFVPTI